MTEIEQHMDVMPPRRRQSVMPRDGDGMTTGPMRRMSRLEPRPSVQYGLSGRRMSHMSRSSFSGASFGIRDFKPPLQLQNTYKLAPDAKERFHSKKAEDVIKSVLKSYLGGEKYSNEICSNLVQQISDVIKGRMKDLGFSQRYKYVCVVTIGQNRNQGVDVVSRCIWNPDTDNFASASYSSGDVFAVASIFATYFE